MPIDISAGEDTKITLSPRVIFFIVAVIIAGYLWLFATFATKAEASDITAQLTAHVVDATLYRLESDLDDIEDKQWQLEQTLAVADSPDKREKMKDFERRADKIKRQISCIRAGGNNCQSGLQ